MITSSKTSSAPDASHSVAETCEEARRRRDDSHVPGDGLDDDAREPFAELGDRRSGGIASLYGTTIVCAVTELGTPADDGMPSVASPEPASARSASTWPW